MGKAKSEATTIRLAKEASWGTNPGAGTYTRVGVNPGGITDWESKNTYVERDPLSTYAAREKGDLVGRTVEPKLTHDLVKDWIELHADAIFRCAAKHNGGTGVRLFRPTAAVDGAASNDSFTVAASGAIADGILFRTRGFANDANNGTFVAAGTSTSTSIKVATGTLVAEASPPANVTLEICGVQGAEDDYEIDASGDLICTSGDFTTMGLVAGQELLIGGSATATQFATIAGQGRATIVLVAAKKITLADQTWTPTADDGADKTIRLGFGSYYRNVPIDHADYLEPSLHGEKEEIGPGTANAAIYTEALGLGVKTFEIDSPLESKIVTTVSYVGKNIPDPVLTADRITGPSTAFAPLAIALIDTASDTKEVRLMDATGNLVAEINSYKLTFENNVKARKVQGSIGAVDLLYGKFEPGLTVEAYFTDWEQAKALNDDRDLRFNAYHENGQVGLCWRMPYTALRGGARSYPANDAVMISLEAPGFRDPDTNVVASLTLFPDPTL